MGNTTDQAVHAEICPAPIEIIQDIIALNEKPGGASRFGSLSGAVYDTAWLSMVSKVDQGHRKPVFPECFNYLLDSQQDDGAWGATASQLDGILNSLAGLLALVTWQRSNPKIDLESRLSDWRIERSQSAIQGLLQSWDVSQSVHVGFEILVPSLLRQLEMFDIHFDFPGYSALMHLHDQKLQKFNATLVYSAKSTTLLHSLEAFVGVIDFDKVSHHCIESSGIFGSPAATAAYLIHATEWDERAERYLRAVAAYGKTGAVPSAYPTCLFEISWTLSTLLVPSLLPRKLKLAEKEGLERLFKETLDQQIGVAGFAPGVLEDVDDTARSLMVLQCLGKSTSADKMIENFQTDNYFRTYRMEGSPSFSANCNVVLSLLGDNELHRYQHHIEKAVTFLLKAEESGPICDKWNLSPQYCRMLFMQTLLAVLDKHNSDALGLLPATLIFERVPSSICRLLGQTLSSQRSDGSWAESLEITAYSILTLAHCLSFPWTATLKAQMKDSILRGRQYLNTEYRTTSKLDYLWVEKVSYRSSLLHTAYCSAALNIEIPEYSWSSAIADCFSLRSGVSTQMGHLFATLPMFQKSNLMSVDLVLIEATQISKRLRKCRDILFARDGIPMTADKYVEFIPMIWVACNHKNEHILSSEIMWEMVLLSLLNFQVDEYMESVVAKMANAELSILVTVLKHECRGTSGPIVAAVDATILDRDWTGVQKRRKLSGGRAHSVRNDLPRDGAVAQVSTPLSRFIHHVRHHWSILQSPTKIQREVEREIYSFLVAHIIQNQDNILLAKSRSTGTEYGLQHVDNERSYVEWVRSTASDNTSCPFSFLFFTSLISEPGRSCFQGARAEYLSKSLCGHLATMCRQYNDYGSAKRDAEECNLNSLDFPEFRNLPNYVEECPPKVQSFGRASGATATSARRTDMNGARSEAERARIEPDDGSENESTLSTRRISAKDHLMAIAEFERSCMQLAMRDLTQISLPATIQRLQVFIDVTDMFGQIYVQRDIASRVKNAAK